MDRQQRNEMLIGLLMIMVLLAEMFLWFTSPGHRLPEMHQKILLTGALLWISGILFRINKSDSDDWAV
ncbi:hypothetical protein SNE26_02580 [Mucilaginibacter sp. cycad4]|uniref:hypothetical protein n=1 Tax=Mucilaginibacter sp. cycad4 TaxID=3342096 RepID=UPI002AAB1B76|nr:hypothetical protein [Mucilaginibacter gossypii]WPV00651.1 hypothetical protein SNE26_02580 [Mucilaginibacter gossypii]